MEEIKSLVNYSEKSPAYIQLLLSSTTQKVHSIYHLQVLIMYCVTYTPSQMHTHNTYVHYKYNTHTHTHINNTYTYTQYVCVHTHAQRIVGWYIIVAVYMCVCA